jgi:glycosyltransferase involved in cell wall biosynthesis
MRILHITPHYHPAVGGSETYTKEISERLVRRGHEVVVLTMNSPRRPKTEQGRPPFTDHIGGVRVVRFDPAGRFHGLLSIAVRAGTVQRALRAVGWQDAANIWASSPYGMGSLSNAIRLRPDVVGVINWYGGALPLQACIARRFHRFAFVGVPLFHTECRWAHAPAYHHMLARCDAVVAMTEHEGEFIRQRAPQAFVFPVGVGVDPAQFADADGARIRRKYGLGDLPVVGYVGRMDESKGILSLLLAMQTVWQVRPDARLLLAGGGLDAAMPSGNAIGSALTGLSPELRAKVTVTGRFADSDKASLFDALDVFAMPSLAESFGIAYLEAWMQKKSVIGSRLASTECVIDAGSDGILVEPCDHDDLANAILTLLSDSGLRERLGQAGHVKTLSRYTWDKLADALERIYEDARERTVS